MSDFLIKVCHVGNEAKEREKPVFSEIIRILERGQVQIPKKPASDKPKRGRPAKSKAEYLSERPTIRKQAALLSIY